MRPRCHKKVQCIAVIKVSCICALVKLNALQPSAFLKPQLGIHFGVSWNCSEGRSTLSVPLTSPGFAALQLMVLMKSWCRKGTWSDEVKDFSEAFGACEVWSKTFKCSMSWSFWSCYFIRSSNIALLLSGPQSRVWTSLVRCTFTFYTYLDKINVTSIIRQETLHWSVVSVLFSMFSCFALQP